MIEESPDYKEKWQRLGERCEALQKENKQLQKELESWEAFEAKLQDRIDGLEQIITILTKIYL